MSAVRLGPSREHYIPHPSLPQTPGAGRLAGRRAVMAMASGPSVRRPREQAIRIKLTWRRDAGP
jgi:hypothetical protein